MTAADFKGIKKNLSIQLSLNGISFAISTAADQPPREVKFDPEIDILSNLEALYMRKELPSEDYAKITLVLDTDRAVLVPDQLFDEKNPRAYLDANSIFPYEYESVVVSSRAMARVVMVWSSDVIDWFKQKYGDDLHFSSPILDSILRPQRGSVEVNLTKENLYLTVFDNVLQYAEVVKYRTFGDILYYLGAVEQLYNLQRNSILVVGYQADKIVKKLEKYYKDVITDTFYIRQV